MTTAQAIIEQLRRLPDSLQLEVLHFVKLLASRPTGVNSTETDDDTTWSQFSLAAALRDMEDEGTPYTLADIKDSL